MTTIKPDPQNARQHTPRNLGQIERSIQSNGFGRSILLANDGTIIAGNATFDAASSAGLDDVLVVESDGTRVIAVKRTDVDPGSPAFHRLAVADNRAAELASWDAAVLQQLAEADQIDISEYFFDDEVDALLASLAEPTTGLTDPDDVPAVPDEPTTKPGDLWRLGRHRLLCGDAEDVWTVDRLKDGEAFDLLMTDPPYGIDAPKMTLGIGKRDFHRGDWDGKRIDIACCVGVASHSCIWGGNYYADILPVTNDWLAWDKKNDGRSFSEFELAWTDFGCNARLFEHHWSGEVKQHPTHKPVDVIAWAIDRAPINQTVIDLFGGSGSTLIACEQTGRRCAMLEIDPHYCDVIVQRWERFTGQTATLASALHETAAD